jgi:hypothetical protein
MQFTNGCHKVHQDGWQTGFLKMLPQIERRLKRVFARQKPELREESIQNAMVFCLIAYARLHQRGRAHVATASNLAWYAAIHTKGGRVAGGRLNIKDPMSRYAQLRRGIRVMRLHHCDPRTKSWIDALVADQRAPVADIVAIRLDFRCWCGRLPKRSRRIACDLAKGCTTAETARKFGVTAGRISQLRRELEASWLEFQQETARLA